MKATPRLRARELTKDDSAAIFNALYNINDYLAGKSPRIRWLILHALCSTYLVEGTDQAPSAGPTKGKT